MIIVCDLAGKPLCYLFTRQQREEFAASCPESARPFLTFKAIPAFSRDRTGSPFTPAA